MTQQSGGLKVQPYYLNGKHAPEMVISFKSFIVLNDLNEFSSTQQNQNDLLVRALKFNGQDFPRWDLISLSYFFQISRSDFQAHNKEKSANIENSFRRQDNKETEVEAALRMFTGKKFEATIDDKRKFILKSESIQHPVHFFYITLSKPEHPVKFKEFRALSVVSTGDLEEEILIPIKSGTC